MMNRKPVKRPRHHRAAVRPSTVLTGVNSHSPGMRHRVSNTTVLVVDMMNSYRHRDAEHLIPNVEKIIDPLSDPVWRTRDAEDADLVYVNDNYGDFTADFSDLVRSACHGERPDLVDPIVPTQHSRALTKVRHSAFYASPVAYLLRRLGTERLILTGQVTEQCIL